MNEKVLSITRRLQETLREKSQRESAAHAQFLSTRQDALEKMAEMIEKQNSPEVTVPAGQGQPILSAPKRPELFSAAQMHEFATGSMAKCFGPEFLVFEGRRYPRIPNRDLMLMSRVIEIQGVRGQFNKPAHILTEYDVPANGWFFRDNNYPTIPYSAWMEIALQPCGFLSAYIGTSFIAPEVDFYFRNLDGTSHLFKEFDARGKVLAVKAKLLSTINSGNTIIQKYDFQVSCEGEPVFEGSSIFGYFPPETMANQAGLDAGKQIPPRFEQKSPLETKGTWFDLSKVSLTRPYFRLPIGHMEFLDRIYIEGNDLYADRLNHPDSWYYACHFYQDPVMPGSLGVEAILEAIQAFAIENGLGDSFRSPRFSSPPGRTMTWKYRGQILPAHKKMKIEVHITGIERAEGRVTILAEASLWSDGMRIYEVKNAAVSIVEAGV